MKSIIMKTAIVLGLGIAPGAAFAQTQPLPIEGQSGVTTDVQTEGGAAATTGTQTEGQADATTVPPTDGQADATTSEPTEGQASGTTAKPTEGQADATTDQPAEGESGTAQTEQPADAQTDTQGTAQTEQKPDDAATQDSTETGAISPDVNVTVEQRTEIRQVIQESGVKPLSNFDFDISVGVAVPRTIEFYPLPPRIVTIVPAYEGYRYFLLADGRIVIVEPDTLEIVFIIV
ncbi:MAG: DUF1236 domain-containing protein [Pseudaminobacter sp.]|nr:DUF1236 domain-containing protein [Pseudaminobacter sp.]